MISPQDGEVRVQQKAVAAGTSGKPQEKRVPGVLRYPQMTEKTTAASAHNKYVFVVADGAHKQAIRRSVEARYGVGVETVNTVNLPGKVRRRGQWLGWKKGLRKAIVTLKKGEKIEIQ